MDIAKIRSQLPVIERWAYLDNAGVAPLPTVVMEAVAASLQSRNLHGKAELGASYRSAFDRCRGAGARLLGAAAADMALVQNTTEGLNIVAQGFPWRPGDNVVTADVEYPSNVYPWLNLARRGVEVRFVKQRGGLISAEDIEAAMDPRTRVLAISHVEFVSGQVNNLERLGGLCRRRGARFVVDAAQSLGALTIDVGAMGIDALASCGWKWLLGPLGTGLFYCAPGLLDELSLTFAGPDSMAPCDLLSYKVEPRAGAARFEYSTHDHAAFQGFAAALEWVEGVGMAPIQERIQRHTAELREGLTRAGYEVLGGALGPYSGIVSFRSERRAAQALAEHLCGEGIYCGERCGYVRFSPHFYNTEDEIAKALDAAAGAIQAGR